MEYSGIFQRKAVTTKSASLIFYFFFNNFTYDILWNMEYSKMVPQQDIILIFLYGIFENKQKQEKY